MYYGSLEGNGLLASLYSYYPALATQATLLKSKHMTVNYALQTCTALAKSIWPLTMTY